MRNTKLCDNPTSILEDGRVEWTWAKRKGFTGKAGSEWDSRESDSIVQVLAVTISKGQRKKNPRGDKERRNV